MVRAYARAINTGQVTWVSPKEDNVSYTIPDLTPGTYKGGSFLLDLQADGVRKEPLALRIGPASPVAVGIDHPARR
jgi:hypothetical protein